jgi:hypothetical protein
MMPRPPTWISVKSTTCPNRLRTFPISITERPVTQAAEVAVKSASTKPRGVPVEAIGNINRAAPKRIKSANARTEYWVGDNTGLGNRIVDSSL